ncbi:MAG: putative DNA binding domain-containing protein [Olsenella sp.]|nr:putative DNA binding domain-containing protein [Olsenella sp.]
MDIPSKETIGIEFKSDKNGIADEVILGSVVALANTDGGHLYLGVEDDGTPTGVCEKHRDTTRLAAFISNSTVPPLPVRVSVMAGERGLMVIDIEVPRSSSVVATSSGRITRRRMKADGTPESVPMYPHEIATRLSSLDKLDYSALPATGTTMADIDPNELSRLRGIVARSRNADRALLELDDEELLRALRLVSKSDGETVPNVAGMLLLGRCDALDAVLPTHSAAFQVLEGTDVRVNQEFGQPLLYVVEQMDLMLEAWNPEREYVQGLFRSSVPEFDRRAFREAVVNAFGHRDYSRLGRVLVQLTDEGMTISNPGGFIEGVTIENLLTVEPHGRNPRLMDALKRIGLAESTGRGVDRIYEGSLSYGRPLPDWSESNSAGVRLFIPRSAPDESFMELLEEERQRNGSPLSLRSMMVLDVLKQQRRASVHELADALHMSDSVVRATVESLVEAGIVEAVGNGRGRTYILGARVYARKGDAKAHALQSDIDAIRHAELVIKLAREQGSVANRDVVELLHVNGKQAYSLLRSLAEEGRLKLRGHGAGARYYPCD